MRRSFNIAKQVIAKQSIKSSVLKIRSLSSVDIGSETNSVHFRATSSPHPLATDEDPKKARKVLKNIHNIT